jgi:hypothetical protein
MNVVVHPTPIGTLHLASDGASLVACEFEGHERGLAHGLHRDGHVGAPDAVLDLASAPGAPPAARGGPP